MWILKIKIIIIKLNILQIIIQEKSESDDDYEEANGEILNQLSMKNIKDNDENIAPTWKNFIYENFD